MNDEKRSKMINIRLNYKELQIFESLCRQDVRSSSSMLRFLIVAEHERRQVASKAADNAPMQNGSQVE